MSRASIVTPIGTVVVDADAEHLLRIDIVTESQRAWDTADPLLAEAMRQIEAWFGGRLDRFDLPLAEAASPRGPAHRAAIAAVDPGETASYGEIARRIGSSPRAVGQACRRNPFPLVVPCHRVVGAGQTIGHYSAGAGIATKRWLLEFEQRRAGRWAT